MGAVPAVGLPRASSSVPVAVHSSGSGNPLSQEGKGSLRSVRSDAAAWVTGTPSLGNQKQIPGRGPLEGTPKGRGGFSRLRRREGAPAGKASSALQEAGGGSTGGRTRLCSKNRPPGLT